MCRRDSKELLSPSHGNQCSLHYPHHHPRSCICCKEWPCNRAINLCQRVLGFSFSNLRTAYGLLWTTLPTLLFSIWKLGWEATLSDTEIRQPFVELGQSKENAASIRQTLMLHYDNYNAILAPKKAFFDHKHPHIGFGMLMTFIVQLVAIPLLARTIRLALHNSKRPFLNDQHEILQRCKSSCKYRVSFLH